MSASPTRRPTPGPESFPHLLIKSPLWSSLTSGHDPARAITQHDRNHAGPALTSREAGGRGRRITDSQPAGWGFDSLAAHQQPVSRANAYGAGSWAAISQPLSR